MTQERIVERKTVTESSPAPRETIEKDYVTGAPHGDEEAGGAVDEKAKDDTVVVTREVRR
jgi:hypothetical protein